MTCAMKNKIALPNSQHRNLQLTREVSIAGHALESVVEVEDFIMKFIIIIARRIAEFSIGFL